MWVEALKLRFGLGPRASWRCRLCIPCEHFPEVGVSRGSTANVLKCLVADAQLK